MSLCPEGNGVSLVLETSLDTQLDSLLIKSTSVKLVAADAGAWKSLASSLY